MDVAIVGGTGAEGSGLALRLLRAGHHVTIGSRSAERAEAAAANAAQTAGDGRADGAGNEEAVRGAGAVIVTVPFAGMIETYRSLAPSLRPGQAVLDATSPLMTAVGGRAWEQVRPWLGSAAETAAAELPDGVPLVAGMHTIAAHVLADLDRPIDSDVLLCSDDEGAKRAIGELLATVEGLRWVDAGPLANARLTEPLTSLLISINRRYRLRDAGFRISGREEWGSPP